MNISRTLIGVSLNALLQCLNAERRSIFRARHMYVPIRFDGAPKASLALTHTHTPIQSAHNVSAGFEGSVCYS